MDSVSDLVKVACVAGVAGGLVGALIGASFAQRKSSLYACVCANDHTIHPAPHISLLLLTRGVLMFFGGFAVVTAAAVPARKRKAKCKVVKTANASPAVSENK